MFFPHYYCSYSEYAAVALPEPHSFQHIPHFTWQNAMLVLLTPLLVVESVHVGWLKTCKEYSVVHAFREQIWRWRRKVCKSFMTFFTKYAKPKSYPRLLLVQTVLVVTNTVTILHLDVAMENNVPWHMQSSSLSSLTYSFSERLATTTLSALFAK